LIHIQKVNPKRALIPIGVGTALSLFGDSTLYTVLPDPAIAAQAGVSLAMVGVLLGANRFARLLFNNLAGSLFDRLPRRRLMIPAMLLGVFSTALYAFGRGAAVMLLGRVLWGAAWSGIWIGSNAIALDISDDSNRGAITGRLQMWFSLGIALTSFGGGLFTDLFTYRGGLWVSASLGALGLLIWLLFLPETRLTKLAFPPVAKDADPDENHFNWRSIAAAAIPLFAVRFTFSGVMNSTTILWLSRYIDGGVTFGSILLPLATITGGIAAARVLVGTASAPLIGGLSDLGRKRWSTLAQLMLAGTAGIALMSLPWLGAGLVGTFLAALTAGAVPSLSVALIGDRVPLDRRSRGLGLIYTFGDLGASLGPVIGLALVPLLGVSRVYLISSGLYGLAAVLVLAASLMSARPEKHSV
jgi:MFS family permease